MNLDKILNREQNKLMQIAKKKGIYENFGQKEVRKLEDKYIDTSDYSDEMNKRRRLINMFDEWHEFCKHLNRKITEKDKADKTDPKSLFARRCDWCRGTGKDGHDRCDPPNYYLCKPCGGTGRIPAK